MPPTRLLARRCAPSRRWLTSWSTRISHGHPPRHCEPSAEDVRDIGLRGQPDDAIFAYAITHGLVVLTADLGFGNLVRFPLGSHHGIVVARFPNALDLDALNHAILAAVHELPDTDVTGNLVVIEPGRIRLRRHS